MRNSHTDTYCVLPKNIEEVSWDKREICVVTGYGLQRVRNGSFGRGLQTPRSAAGAGEEEVGAGDRGDQALHRQPNRALGADDHVRVRGVGGLRTDPANPDMIIIDDSDEEPSPLAKRSKPSSRRHANSLDAGSDWAPSPHGGGLLGGFAPKKAKRSRSPNEGPDAPPTFRIAKPFCREHRVPKIFQDTVALVCRRFGAPWRRRRNKGGAAASSSAWQDAGLAGDDVDDDAVEPGSGTVIFHRDGLFSTEGGVFSLCLRVPNEVIGEYTGELVDSKAEWDAKRAKAEERTSVHWADAER